MCGCGVRTGDFLGWPMEDNEKMDLRIYRAGRMAGSIFVFGKEQKLDGCR